VTSHNRTAGQNQSPMILRGNVRQTVVNDRKSRRQRRSLRSMTPDDGDDDDDDVH